MSDTYQIAIRSYQAANVPLAGTAVHNEVVFMRNNEPLFAFNGDAYDRETGALRERSTSGEDTLRVRVFQGTTLADYAGEDYPLRSQTTVAEVSQEDFVRQLARATEAAHFINSQNLNYIIVGAPLVSGHLFDAQNSNSAANTLLTAAGLSVPANVRDQWAPGQNRVLLPENWKPQTDAMTHEQRIAYLNQNLPRLEESEVGAQAARDPNPNKPELHKPEDFPRPPSQIFFDPRGGAGPS